MTDSTKPPRIEAPLASWSGDRDFITWHDDRDLGSPIPEGSAPSPSAPGWHILPGWRIAPTPWDVTFRCTLVVSDDGTSE